MPHLAIFGGTGPSGLCAIEEALSRNHTVTIFARNPSKLPSNIAPSKSVSIVEGSLSDREAVVRTIHGADAVLSTLGPSLSVGTAVDGLKNCGTPIADGYKIILDVMNEEGVKRLIALGTISMHAEQDGDSIVTKAMVAAVWTFLHAAWNDVVTIGK